MNKNKKAESFVGIIIGIMIFTIIAMGLLNVISYNNEISNDYKNINFENIIKTNSNNILKKLDLASLGQNQDFYLYKNNSSKNFEVLTGSSNSGSKYVYINGNKVDDVNGTYEYLYKREFRTGNDFVKNIKTPNSMTGLVLHLDAKDINGDGNYSNNPTDGSSISTWVDKSGKGHNATQSTESNKPILKNNIINGYSSLLFSGNQYFIIPDSVDLNSNPSGYKEKTFAIVFKTGTGLYTSDQRLYFEGVPSNFYSFYIEGGHLKSGILGSTNNTLDFGEILQNTIYSIFMVQNSQSTDGNYKTFYIYSKGKLVSKITNIENQLSHAGNIYIGRGGNGKYYSGYIGEFLSWNYALNKNDIEGLNNYFNSRWTNSSTDIKVNSSIKNIKTFISN